MPRYFFLLLFLNKTMANELSKPMATLDHVYRIIEGLLDGRRLNIVKNIVFILVLLNYWSFLYRKVLVGGPVRAILDLQAFVKRVYISIYIHIHI